MDSSELRIMYSAMTNEFWWLIICCTSTFLFTAAWNSHGMKAPGHYCFIVTVCHYHISSTSVACCFGKRWLSAVIVVVGTQQVVSDSDMLNMALCNLWSMFHAQELSGMCGIHLHPQCCDFMYLLKSVWLLCISLWPPRLIPAIADWMSAILPRMVWPECEFKMQVWN